MLSLSILIPCTFNLLYYTSPASLWNCATEITNLAWFSAHSNGCLLHRWHCALIVCQLVITPFQKTNGNLSCCSLMWDCLEMPPLLVLSYSLLHSLYSRWDLMRIVCSREEKKTHLLLCWHCCHCKSICLFSWHLWSLSKYRLWCFEDTMKVQMSQKAFDVVMLEQKVDFSPFWHV